MRAVIETTKWADGVEAYNHVYLLDGDQCLAYIPHNTRDIRYFDSPRRIKLGGRTFKELKYNPFQLPKDEPQNQVLEVQGSQGQTYFVTQVGGEWSCSCPGHVFRGQCKHVETAKNSG